MTNMDVFKSVGKYLYIDLLNQLTCVKEICQLDISFDTEREREGGGG